MVNENTLRLLNRIGFGADIDSLESYLLNYAIAHKLTDMEKYELVYTRILLQKPELVLIIQPFKGADARLRQRIWELQEALIDRGATLVLLAVNMADCLAIANRVIRIDGDMTIREYREDSFGELPLTIPLISLYEEESYE